MANFLSHLPFTEPKNVEFEALLLLSSAVELI